MTRKRKAYAPFSLTSEAGVAQTPLEGYIDVDQQIYPTVNTGTVNENGRWSGVKSSDTEFKHFTKAVAIANGGETLTPDTGTRNFIDMTGFTDLFLACKTTTSGNFAITAVFGPDTNRFFNLEPIGSARVLRGASLPANSTADIQPLLEDGAQNIPADVWEVFHIQGVLKDQPMFQFKIVNNTGTQVDLETAFMRMV